MIGDKKGGKRSYKTEQQSRMRNIGRQVEVQLNQDKVQSGQFIEHKEYEEHEKHKEHKVYEEHEENEQHKEHEEHHAPN